VIPDPSLAMHYDRRGEDPNIALLDVVADQTLTELLCGSGNRGS